MFSTVTYFAALLLTDACKHLYSLPVREKKTEYHLPYSYYSYSLLWPWLDVAMYFKSKSRLKLHEVYSQVKPQPRNLPVPWKHTPLADPVARNEQCINIFCSFSLLVHLSRLRNEPLCSFTRLALGITSTSYIYLFASISRVLLFVVRNRYEKIYLCFAM